jgi:dTDP-L-rhamnose 4-epimerase
MRVLITGGAGFIGTATGKALIKEGYDVRVLDNLQPPVHPKSWDPYGAPGAEFFQADVRNGLDLTNLLKDVDIVLHLAAYQDYRQDWSTFFETNSAGTAKIYEVIVRDNLPVQKVVLASTQSLIGEGAYDCDRCGIHFLGHNRSVTQVRVGNYDMLCPECGAYDTQPAWTKEEEINPAIPYGISKLAAELISTRLGAHYDIPTVNLRYSIVQGMTQSPKNAYSGVLRAVALQILGGSKEIIVFEDAQQLRDFVSIEDVVAANLMAIKGEVPDGAYHVGGGQAYTLEYLANSLIEISGANAELSTPGLFRVGDIRHTLSDITKMQGTGWSPQEPIETTWKKYWEWLVEVMPREGAKEIVDQAYDTMLKSGTMGRTSK